MKNASSAWNQLRKNIAIYDEIDSANKLRQLEQEQSNVKLESHQVKRYLYGKENAKAQVNVIIYERLKMLNSKCSFLYTQIIHDLFLIMEQKNFFTDQSVGANFETLDGKKRTALNKTSLFDHSLNVYEEMNLICDLEYIPSHYKDVLLFIALTHDFGKSQAIRNEHAPQLAQEKEDRNHHKVSAIFARNYLNSYNLRTEDNRLKIQERDIEIIFNVINYHHDEKVPDAIKKTLSYLQMADNNARVKEKKYYGIVT